MPSTAKTLGAGSTSEHGHQNSPGQQCTARTKCSKPVQVQRKRSPCLRSRREIVVEMRIFRRGKYLTFGGPYFHPARGSNAPRLDGVFSPELMEVFRRRNADLNSCAYTGLSSRERTLGSCERYLRRQSRCSGPRLIPSWQ